MPILKPFLRTISRYQMLKPKARVLLGVSGGPDSLAMLCLFDELRKTWGLKIYVAHLDHGLRRAADSDMVFVRGICKDMNIPFTAKKIAVKKLFKKGSLEENCRKARLDFLIRTAKKVKADIVGLGHNRDDQAETVLMRLLRGSGLSGLGGIFPKRKIEGITFIRPLIETGRRDIEKYCKGRGIAPCQDLSNKDMVFLRNRIRHKLLPHLSRCYNRNIKDILCSTGEILSADYDYLYKEGLRAFNKCAVFSWPAIKINLRKFNSLHPAMQRMVMRLSVEKIKGNTRKVTFRHWGEIEELIGSRKSGSVVNLPCRVAFKKEAGTLRVSVSKS